MTPFPRPEELWSAEDKIRLGARAGDLGAPGFVEAARGICRANDRLADLKRRVNAVPRCKPGDRKENRADSGTAAAADGKGGA